MIPEPVHLDILDRLKRAEAEHDVKVLLAVESGSRAWGFASPNSDYDARFIYVNRRDWYLSVSLEEQRDVIEYPIVDEIDINGWDLRKPCAPCCPKSIPANAASIITAAWRRRITAAISGPSSSP